MATCARAARQEGVAIAQAAGEPCVLAELTLMTRYGGKAQADCADGVCSASDIHRKTLRMKVRDPQTREVLLESVALIESNRSGVLEGTVYALCAATFRGYPHPARNLEQKIILPAPSK